MITNTRIVRFPQPRNGVWRSLTDHTGWNHPRGVTLGVRGKSVVVSNASRRGMNQPELTGRGERMRRGPVL